MKIYYAPHTRAVRVVWLFEELGLEYELQSFQVGEPSMRAPDYLKIHPLGRVPVLEDGDIRLYIERLAERSALRAAFAR